VRVLPAMALLLAPPLAQAQHGMLHHHVAGPGGLPRAGHDFAPAVRSNPFAFPVPAWPPQPGGWGIGLPSTPGAAAGWSPAPLRAPRVGFTSFPFWGGYGPGVSNNNWVVVMPVVYPPPPAREPAPPTQPSAQSRPVLYEYGPEYWAASGFSPDESKTPSEYLIVLTDGSINAASLCWVINNTFFFVPEVGGTSSIPLSRVDKERTERLNRERGIAFLLPPASP